MSSRLCYDFNDLSDDDDWTPEGGQWAATSAGAYVGIGPAAPVNCPADAGSYMTASLLDGFSAANVRMHVQMTGGAGPDKVLVLRARDGRNRIELNFRSNFGPLSVHGGDLVVQEIVDCVNADHVPQNTIAIPHAMNDVLDVDLELRGRQLQVWIGGNSVFDAEVPGISTEAGAVGLAVFINGTIRFDNFIVESLD